MRWWPQISPTTLRKGFTNMKKCIFRPLVDISNRFCTNKFIVVHTTLQNTRQMGAVVFRTNVKIYVNDILAAIRSCQPAFKSYNSVTLYCQMYMWMHSNLSNSLFYLSWQLYLSTNLFHFCQPVIYYNYSFAFWATQRCSASLSSWEKACIHGCLLAASMFTSC